MGQNLFSPPNVKGWPGGDVWINTTTLLARKQFVDRVLRADEHVAAASASATSVPADAGGNGMSARTDAAPMQVVAAVDASDAAARRQRFLQRMERDVSSVRFDGTRWLAQLPGATPVERGRRAQRLLLAVEPQQPVDFSAEPLAARARARARCGVSAEVTGASMDRRRFLGSSLAMLGVAGAGASKIAFGASPRDRPIASCSC